MKNSIIGVLVALALVAAVAGGYWLGQRPANNAASATNGGGNAAASGAAASNAAGGNGNAGVAVEAMKVAVASLPQSITAVGSLRSDESVTLRPEVAGRISTIGFGEGQRVTKGALLVRLDPAINEAEVQ